MPGVYKLLKKYSELPRPTAVSIACDLVEIRCQHLPHLQTEEPTEQRDL